MRFWRESLCSCNQQVSRMLQKCDPPFRNPTWSSTLSQREISCNQGGVQVHECTVQEGVSSESHVGCFCATRWFSFAIRGTVLRTRSYQRIASQLPEMLHNFDQVQKLQVVFHRRNDGGMCAMFISLIKFLLIKKTRFSTAFDLYMHLGFIHQIKQSMASFPLLECASICYQNNILT